MNANVINTLIENPRLLLILSAESLPSVALAYWLVWLAMRPKTNSGIHTPFSWHLYGIATSLLGSTIFRIIAIATFAGRDAYTGDKALYYPLTVSAIIATLYIHWLKQETLKKSTNADWKETKPQNTSEKTESIPPNRIYETEKTESIPSSQLYEIIAEEMDRKEYKKGLATRAFAEANGDKELAKSLYIKFRYAELFSEMELERKEKQRVYTPSPTEPDSPKANISPHEWRGYFAHLAEKVSIIKSYIALFFKIFGYQIVVALVYMFGSADLVPNFSGLINFPFFDFVFTFLFSMLAPALFVYIALIPFHLIFIWLKKPLPFYTQAIIALLSLSLVILDFTKINPLLTGYRGLGAYDFTPSIMKNTLQVTSLITNSAKDVVQKANKLYNQGNFEEAFPLLQGLAKQGDTQAQYNLGYMYESGNGITKNNYLAIYWYNEAAQQGNANAIAALKKLGQ